MRQTVEFSGFGLQRGNPVAVKVHPGNEGIAFRSGNDRFLAIPSNVTDTEFCTRLGTISTIEHMMSALAGLEITDAEIEVVGDEMPALDGASFTYLCGFEEVGLQVIGKRAISGPFNRVWVHDDTGKIAISTGTGHWRYIFHSPNRYPFDQTFETSSIHSDYKDQVAGARTFGWQNDLERVRAAGLAKGLDLDNALLLGEEGPINEPKWPDEPVRHKVLDACGDLYLAGVPLRILNFTGEQSGHRLNVEAASKLARAIKFEDVE